MELGDVVRAATEAPAQALRRLDLGTLRPGATGDASILSLERGAFDYVDVASERMTGDRRLAARGTVVNGRWWNWN